MTDCLIHTKSALDSMSVFLTDLLGLQWKGGDRDFKKSVFRDSICQKDMFLKLTIKKLEPWFLELQSIRDDWIHINTIESISVQGKSEIGMLPIPKRITASSEEQEKMKLDSAHFWSTQEFVKHHYSNLKEMFIEIVDRSIQIEKKDFDDLVTVPDNYLSPLSYFPMTSAENMTINNVRFYNPTSVNDW